jgi:predicted regulator of Ras-like GTPase activity (Roadblock/LC7/MglB family)
MSDTKAERLASALNDFIASSPDVEAAAIVSFDGLAMASALPEDMDEDRLGAMSAALLSLGEQAASGLGRGELSQVFVEGEHGYVFLMSARDEAVLATITSKQAKIGFMLFEMRRAAEVIGELLEQRVRDPYAGADHARADHGEGYAAGAVEIDAAHSLAQVPDPSAFGDGQSNGAHLGAALPPWS